MSYLDADFSIFGNGTKGPALLLVEHILHLHQLPLSFERSRRCRPVLAVDPELEVRALYEIGIDNLRT